VDAGVPRLQFRHAPEIVAEATLPDAEPLSDAVSEWIDPLWTSFRSGESQVRHALLRTGAGRCYWVMTASHIVCDGRSFDLMYSDMVNAMFALADGKHLQSRQLPSFETNVVQEREREQAVALLQPPTEWASYITDDARPCTIYGIETPRNELFPEQGYTIIEASRVEQLAKTCEHTALMFRSIDVTMANFFTAMTAAWCWRHGAPARKLPGIPFHDRDATEANLFGFKSEVSPRESAGTCPHD
jgi:hypothetical protein